MSEPHQATELKILAGQSRCGTPHLYDRQADPMKHIRHPRRRWLLVIELRSLALISTSSCQWYSRAYNVHRITILNLLA